MHAHAERAEKPLHISSDETSIRLHQDAGAGFLAEKARTVKRSAMSLTDFAEFQAMMPSNVILHRDEKAWMNSQVMVQVIQKLASTLNDVLKHRAVILFADVYKSHISNVVWTACARAGIYYCVIPAKLTWALQPCDTHLFAAFKRHLSTLCQQIVVNSSTCALSLCKLLEAVRDTIAAVLVGKDWSAAFRDVGLVGHQRTVSDRTMQKCCFPERPSINNSIPSLQQLQAIFPRNMTIPIDAIFRTLTKDYGSTASSSCSKGATRPITRSVSRALQLARDAKEPGSSSLPAPALPAAPKTLPLHVPSSGTVPLLRRLPSRRTGDHT